MQMSASWTSWQHLCIESLDPLLHIDFKQFQVNEERRHRSLTFCTATNSGILSILDLVKQINNLYANIEKFMKRERDASTTRELMK